MAKQMGELFILVTTLIKCVKFCYANSRVLISRSWKFREVLENKGTWRWKRCTPPKFKYCSFNKTFTFSVVTNLNITFTQIMGKFCHSVSLFFESLQIPNIFNNNFWSISLAFREERRKERIIIFHYSTNISMQSLQWIFPSPKWR